MEYKSKTVVPNFFDFLRWDILIAAVGFRQEIS